jgi:hypothetical protein
VSSTLRQTPIHCAQPVLRMNDTSKTFLIFFQPVWMNVSSAPARHVGPRGHTRRQKLRRGWGVRVRAGWKRVRAAVGQRAAIA